MKKLHRSSMVLFCLLSLYFTANAQKENKQFSAGFGLEAGLPVGSANTAYHFTSGIDIRFSYRAGPGFVTLSSGLLAYVPKTGQGSSTKASLQIPIKAGYKYVFYKPFFAMFEAGYSSFRVYYSGSNGVASNSTGGFTYAPTIGVNFNVLELGIKYEGTSLSGGSISAIDLRLAFNF